MKLQKTQARERRHLRIRRKVRGTADRPRLCIYKSNGHIYAQLIDDDKGVTVVSASDLKATKGNKTERAKKVGEDVAKKATEKKITTCVFDRGGYKYHGRVKAVAEAARENGLKF